MSLPDLFLASCCVNALWLCNLPHGLKTMQIRYFCFFSPLLICHCSELGFCCSCFVRINFLTLFLLGHMQQSLSFFWGLEVQSRSHLPSFWPAWADGIHVRPFPHLLEQKGGKKWVGDQWVGVLSFKRIGELKKTTHGVNIFSLLVQKICFVNVDLKKKNPIQE